MKVFHLRCASWMTQVVHDGGIIWAYLWSPDADPDLDPIVTWAIDRGGEVREHKVPSSFAVLDPLRYAIVFHDDAAAVEFKLVWGESDALVEGSE